MVYWGFNGGQTIYSLVSGKIAATNTDHLYRDDFSAELAATNADSFEKW